MNENINLNREHLLKKIMELDFGINDLVLFLDTHPYDTNALELKNEYGRECQKLKKIYEEKFGPLVVQSETKDWSLWVNTPWPWERGAR